MASSFVTGILPANKKSIQNDFTWHIYTGNIVQSFYIPKKIDPQSFYIVRKNQLATACTVCVAVCCSVLQCVAVCCSVLQCVAVCCSVLQSVAERCIVLQCVAVCYSVVQCDAVICSAVQCGAACVKWLKNQIADSIWGGYGLFCRISSLLQGSFAKETYNWIDPTNRSHPIVISTLVVMGWLWLVGSIKVYVSFANEP